MRNDDLDIQLDDAQPRAVSSAPLLEHEPSVSVGYLGRPNMGVMPVYFCASALRQIEGHAASYPEREVGGVLLGQRFEHNGSPFLVIQQSIPGLKAEGFATHVTFTHATWQQITQTKDRQFPELQIVGWYHSHPDLGLFLSRDDQYIQRNFFGAPWQVALVVDPVNWTRALFLWQQGALVQDEGLRLYAPAKEKALLQEYLTVLTAGRRASSAAPAVPPPPIQLVFCEPNLNLYRCLPASWCRFLGIADVRTAPRLSLKSLLILLLLVLLALQYWPKQPAHRPPAHHRTLAAAPAAPPTTREETAAGLPHREQANDHSQPRPPGRMDAPAAGVRPHDARENDPAGEQAPGTNPAGDDGDRPAQATSQHAGAHQPPPPRTSDSTQALAPPPANNQHAGGSAQDTQPTKAEKSSNQ